MLGVRRHLDEMAGVFERAARESLRQRQFAAAVAAIEQGLLIAPGHARLRQLRRHLAGAGPGPGAGPARGGARLKFAPGRAGIGPRIDPLDPGSSHRERTKIGRVGPIMDPEESDFEDYPTVDLHGLGVPAALRCLAQALHGARVRGSDLYATVA